MEGGCVFGGSKREARTAPKEHFREPSRDTYATREFRIPRRRSKPRIKRNKGPGRGETGVDSDKDEAVLQRAWREYRAYPRCPLVDAASVHEWRLLPKGTRADEVLVKRKATLEEDFTLDEIPEHPRFVPVYKKSRHPRHPLSALSALPRKIMEVVLFPPFAR
ncbi:hypothetical protein KM043_003728 [Ampulex compressa]|nr:hypothetical protein KM043_003728 [Ampulex compressa]